MIDDIGTSALNLENAMQPCFAFRLEPAGPLRPVRQDEEDHDGKNDGGAAGGEEHPLPAAETHKAVKVEQGASDRGTDRVGDGTRDHEPPHHAAAVILRKPERQGIKHTGKEAGLAGAQEETQDIEHRGVLGEPQKQRDEAPAGHDPGEPEPGSDPLENDVARYLEDKIADEEQ